jgi:adenosylcobinamide kinase / adenosylcobinamide-phosphate guanylyltransferase
MPLTFLTGGARSGKSTLALELARRSGRDVTFIATAPRPDSSAGPGVVEGGTVAGGMVEEGMVEGGIVDREMAARIERHQLERRDQPGRWLTVEEPLDVVGALQSAAGTFTIVDCLTLWVSNLMWAGRTDEEIERLGADAAAVAAGMPNPVVVVTNEVGMGIHPDAALGRRYRDVLGLVNQSWAGAADHALLMIAGRAVRLDDPVQLLEGGGAPR